MKFLELRTIHKLYFGYEEIARVLGISPASARISASRYVRQGLLVRIKRNMYVLQEVWNTLGRAEKFVLVNMGQTPSYLSLMTALDYYEITTQMQRDFFESVAVKRTKEIQINGSVFRYSKIAGNLYFGFKKEKEYFIATPEKALVDAFYLMSYGRYSLDISALDSEKLDRDEIIRLSEEFPSKTKKMLKKYGYLKTA
ncbi:MAG: type IV toxin-antitoxin system AbiEi family antitoxin domain-containing protein [Planctomycetota bacterium]|jgi:predicted transcriptional regulator of viral defense system